MQLIRRSSLTGMALVLAAQLLASRGLCAEPDQADVIQRLAVGFSLSPTKLEKLELGDHVDSHLVSISDNELAVSVAADTAADAPWLLRRFDENEPIRTDPAILQFGVFEENGSGDGVPAALLALQLNDEELDRRAEAEPGTELNLSSEERAQLHAAAATQPKDDTLRRAAVMGEFRKVLAARLNAYRNGGVSAITAYDREGKGGGDPAAELSGALQQLRVTGELAPSVRAAMENVPHPVPKGVRSRFYWLLQEANGRTVAALSHRVAGSENGVYVSIERRFYIGHTFNSMQVTAVALPTETGTLVFYGNRTFTDLVTGFGSSVARSVGRRIMRGEIDKAFEDFGAIVREQ